MKYYFTLQYIKFWLIFCSKSIRPAKTIHILSLSFIARGEKQIRSVIAITSKPGTRDPKVLNAKTRDRVPNDPGQSHPIPGFSSPHKIESREISNRKYFSKQYWLAVHGKPKRLAF